MSIVYATSIANASALLVALEVFLKFLLMMALRRVILMPLLL